MAQSVVDLGQRRYERGRQIVDKLDRDADDKVIAALSDIAPDFSRYIFEFAFGDIYSRPGLDLRSREIAAIASLAALGNASAQLRVQIEAAMNIGLDRDEIIGLIIQTAVYSGFPAAMNELLVAKEVFSARSRPLE
ncbi:carboxymuconolactone decarboxylase family protein [Pararhizobium sp. DWP1-1-3]|uniref:carboxymuconolactone decarboxylase family protein n=1 Tax=Pararhizobium sp. DWP1-1-3 TaxID=2804652 RepID=UPI003CF0C97D